MYADAGFAFAFAAAYSPTLTSSQPQPPPPPFDYAFSSEPPLLSMPAMDHDAYLGNLVQPSMVSEYDLGGEGDLFKAPEAIIEEPLLSLDPVAAAFSMMAGNGSAVMDQTIKDAGIGTIQNDPLLSEVLYECEKELMEKSTIEETISELMDVKIPMLQVEEIPSQAEQVLIQNQQLPAMEKEKQSVPECSLQKSVSSGCLNSADWMNGPARPNFLDFQGLDFEAAFGLRRAYSEGDIQNLGANTPRPAANVCVTISDLKTEERKQKLSRYRKYACRKALADSQPRVRGRFAKIEECDLLKPSK
ncbi:CCT motif family protein [Zea mays]|uniref:CCT motif family protein n=1 Tax=Zea mays TaxID=4577 RepID=A0A1D6FLY6_MAIZE|nr:CCT motif family protein [Zea mays]